MVKIRLRRVGKKGQPSFRVVVSDARAPREGRFIAAIGTYNPRTEPSTIQIDTEQAVEWLRKGAQPTEAVSKLFEIAGVADRFRTQRPRSA
jgi:small subunit ribosomal protein S16